MRRPLPFALLLLLLAVSARADAVLVIPFFNLSSSSSLDWIGVSIAQALREGLASEGLLVLDRQEREEAYRRLSIRPYARLTRATVIKVAEALDAGEVIYGEFEVLLGEGAVAGGSPGSLRITAHLLDASRLRKGPEFGEAGALEDLTKLQNDLAWQALRILAPGSTPSAEEFQKARPPVRVNAMENYVRGLVASSAEQKHRFFTQAARLDDGFSQPCFELGRLYWEKKEYRLAAPWLARVRATDPHYLEANFLLGLCRYRTADYDGAQRAFELVSRTLPLNEVFNNLGAALSRRNRPGALENFRKALEGDPADPDYYFNVGYVLWKAGDFSAAADAFRAVLDRNPEDALSTLMLGRCLNRSGLRPGDPRSEGLERLKYNYEERAYRQLKATLGSK
jgi:tetratricopeptide (TPR) repeat protein